MPAIAYQGAHGSNDYPLHFAFFEAMESRGLLDQIDFFLDPSTEYAYCKKLIRRFPQLQLTSSTSLAGLAVHAYARSGARGGGLFAKVNRRYDAVIEGPGGRIHPRYLGNGDIFWRYPTTERRAIVFHSIEGGILRMPRTAASIAGADLILARSTGSAAIARQAGAPRVHATSDIVFSQQAADGIERPGGAVALRSPNAQPGAAYIRNVEEIVQYLADLRRPIDCTSIEPPLTDFLDAAARRNGFFVLNGDEMYMPFLAKRDFVISCRLHTTILALKAGNRKVIQFGVEEGTQKLKQIFGDLGLTQLTIHPRESLNRQTIQSFVEGDDRLDDAQVRESLRQARESVLGGLDILEEWLLSLGKGQRTSSPPATASAQTLPA